MLDAFISYSNLDSTEVYRWLIPGLEERGVKVWVDRDQILPGDVLHTSLTDALRRCRFALFVLSPSFLSSRWTMGLEYQVSIDKYIREGRSRPIAAMLTPCEIPSPLDATAYADFTNPATREEELNKLAAQLRGDRKVVRTVPAAPPPEPARYRNFDVTLSPASGDDYGLRVHCGAIGGNVSETTRLDREDLQRRTAAVRAGTATRAECEDLGALLHRKIYTPAVRQMWERAHDTGSRTAPATLRIRVRTPDADTIALPWELLHDGTAFLTVAGHYPIVRYSADLEGTQFAPIANANVLLVDASSGNGISNVRASLEPLLRAGKLGHVELLQQPTLRALRPALRDRPYHVVHLIADCDDAGRLLMGDRTFTGEALELLLHDAPVRLLVLCVRECVAGTGLQLAAETNRFGVPAVLALQHAGDTAPFLDDMYALLAEGCPLEKCVAEGRKAMVIYSGWEKPHWALPVLFNDHPDAMLFRDAPREWCAATKQQPLQPERPAAAPPPNNVPAYAAIDLPERKNELARLRTLVMDTTSNIVLVKGPPGVGASAFIMRFAADAVSRNVDRWKAVVWIAPTLAEATGMQQLPRDTARPYTLDGLATVILMTVGGARLARLGSAARLTAAAALLAEGAALVVIDDVAAASADAVRAFIQAMPKTVRFLVTASERLGIGELELDLAPLARGYPFGLRAEGSEASGSTPEEYTRALLKRLPEVELRILAVCATLPFPSAASIVAHATGVDRDGFDGAADSLSARGLIERSPNGQLSLCGTLRTLFRDTSGLDVPDMLHPVLDALREHARGAGWHPDRAGMVEPELGNLVWAVQRAYAAGRMHDLEPLRIALDDSLYRLDYWRLGAALGELAFLAASGTGNRNEMAWAALYPTTRVLYHAEDFAAAERWCAVALAIFEAQDHHEGTIAARRYLGRVKWSQGDRGRARSLFSSALERAWWTPENHGQLGLMLATMAAFEHSENNLDEAERLYRQTLDLYGPHGKPEGIGPTYDALGRIALARGEADQALGYFQRARDVLQHIHWDEQRASVAFSIGLAHEQRHDFDSAVRELGIARGIFADIGAQAQVAAVDAALLRVQSREGRARH